jgi:hypothetical protein
MIKGGTNMDTREIPRDQWVKFFDDFSRRYKGWIVTLEVIGSDIGDQEEANGLPLVGISADLKDRENRIVIIVGGQPDADVTCVIENPKRVWLKEHRVVGDEAVDIESEGGNKTLLSFHHTPLERTDRQLPKET